MFEKLNIVDKNTFSKIVFDGVHDLSDFFHCIKFSKKVFNLNHDESLKALIYIINTFTVNQLTEIAGKSAFIENDSGRQMNREERMKIIAQDSLNMMKDMFEAVINYQVERNNARK